MIELVFIEQVLTTRDSEAGIVTGIFLYPQQRLARGTWPSDGNSCLAHLEKHNDLFQRSVHFPLQNRTASNRSRPLV